MVKNGKCEVIEGRLQKPCDALQDFSIKGHSKRQGLYLNERRNKTSKAWRLAAYVRFTGINENIMLNFCPYCGAVIHPEEFASQQEQTQ